MTKIQARLAIFTRWSAALAVVGLGWLAATPAGAASFQEPATTFYGKVIGTGSSRPFLVTEGELVWTIRRADGADLDLRASLFPLHGGEFSYRLDVPHEVLASGLQASAQSVPVSAAAQTHAHLLITVDGLPARLLGPSGSTFNAAQALRASTYRLDLDVPLTAIDSDGDGIPDWWEDLYGEEETGTDTDGDGINNLNEFRNGYDPRHDDRVPTLATSSARIYADGMTVFGLKAVDVDSEPAELQYTLVRGSELGTLLLRNAQADAGSPDRALGEGEGFTQADVDAGRVVFQQNRPAGGSSASTLEVTLRDEDPAHPVSNQTVALYLYKPGQNAVLSATAETPRALPEVAGFSRDELPNVVTYLLSRDRGYVAGDASADLNSTTLRAPSAGLTPAQYQDSYMRSYGPDKHHVLLGGLSGDHLIGGMESDILMGGPGPDQLRGNGGADLFVLTDVSAGNDVIEDFSLLDQDVLDLSRALNGTSTELLDYVQLAVSGSDTLIRINTSGTGGSYNELVVTLAGSAIGASDIFDLVEGGALVTGNKTLPSRVTLLATVPAASENGPTAAEVVLSRRGSVQGPLTVNLLVTGSAANGVDYHYLPSQVTFAAGQRSVTLSILPYVDTLSELTEGVELRLLAGAGYEIGADNVAQVVIEDLLPMIAIETLEPMAVKSTLQPGFLLITRSGIIDRSVLVRLNIGGTAANYSDYEGIPNFLNFAAGQTSLLLPVTPKATAVLSRGAESVSLGIRPDATYKVGSPAQATVMLVETMMTFVNWKQTAFPAVNEEPAIFAQGDFGDKGIRNLLRYAYQLDPLTPELTPEALPRFEILDGRFTVIFRRPAAITDLDYVVEVSEDLQTWHAGDGYLEPFYPLEYAGDLNVQAYRAVAPVSDAAKHFIRVRVVYRP